MNNIDALTLFAKVVKENSFSGAANKLGLTRSAVSKQIARLEEELGVRLFHRNTRSLHLTEIGMEILKHADSMIDQWQKMHDMVNEYQGDAKGLLKLTSASNFGRLHIAPYISEFIERYPEINIELRLTDFIEDIVDEGVDIAIRISTLHDSSLIAQKIADNPLVLVASPDYVAKHGKPKTVEELKKHNCLTFLTRSHIFENWRYMHGDEILSTNISGNYQINDAECVLNAVKAGQGISLATCYMTYSDITEARLVQLLPEIDFVQSNPIYMVYPERKYQPPKTKAFIAFLKEKYGNQPYWLNPFGLPAGGQP